MSRALSLREMRAAAFDIGCARTRDVAADIYARVLAKTGPAGPHWKLLNEAVTDRWSPAGLEYVKKRAWKIAQERKTT